MTPSQVLSQTFGLEQFRAGQIEVVERLLAGRSALAIFPTGAGKSLCYQLPAVMLEGLTVVVSPLIALMKDQLDGLRRRGIAAARLDSSLDRDTTRQVYSDLRAGRLKLLYIAPERLGNERFLEALQGGSLALLAIDEAHCISEWGHNFRPDYMKLAELARELGFPRVLGLTATAPPEVADSVARAFDIAPQDVVRCPSHRPNLELSMRPGPASTRDARLLECLGKGATIIYVTLQRSAEEVAAFLRRHGYTAMAYHAGLDAERRNSVQDHFMSSPDAVVVATIAFGMGVDKADIRNVIHYNLPKSVENYAQEIGRAGRDGLPSRCTMLAAPEDRIALENFSFGDTPLPSALEALIEELLGSGEEFDVSVYDLSQRYDIRNLVVETVLAYLELDGVLRATRPFYAEYKLAWLHPQEQVLARFDPARADFLRRLLACAESARKWARLDVHRASQQLGEPRDRLVRALNYLEEQGHIELQVSGVRQGYRRLPGSHQAATSAARLNQRFHEREIRDLERLARMQALIHEQHCVTAALLGYFGESLPAACGHCSACAGSPAAPVERLAAPLTPSQRARVRLHDHEALQHPRQLARFLCGLTSPASTRARLSKHPDFGSLAEAPFPQVLQATTEVCATPTG